MNFVYMRMSEIWVWYHVGKNHWSYTVETRNQYSYIMNPIVDTHHAYNS